MAFQLTRLNVPSLTTDYSAETNAAAQLGKTVAGLPGQWQKQGEAETKRLGMLGIGEDLKSGNFQGAASKAALLGDIGAAAQLYGLGQKAQEQQRKSEWMRNNAGILGDVGASAAPTAAPLGQGVSARGGSAAPRPFYRPVQVAETEDDVARLEADMERRSQIGYGNPQLPAGMRNNNPGNIKFVGLGQAPGVVGPSQNTDQGDPQAVFNSPEAGMSAAYDLALRKYQGGKRTALDLIAGQGGWTPGNTAAAANVARSMGLSPNDDLRLDDPQRAQSFLRALAAQEHGRAGASYPQEMVASAVGARGGQAPTQVAQAPQAAPQGGGTYANVPVEVLNGFLSNPKVPENFKTMMRQELASRQSAPVQVAEAPAQPGSPVADMPAQGAASAQFVIPGTTPAQTQAITTDPQVRQYLRALDGAPEEFKAGIQKRLDLRVEELKQTRSEQGVEGQLKQEQLTKARRENAGEEPIALTPEDRQRFGIAPDQAAYRTRDGIKFGPAGTKIINEAQKLQGAEDKARVDINTKFIGKLADSGPQVAQRMADMDVLAAVIRDAPPGPTADVQVFFDRLGAGLGLTTGELATRSDAMKAIVQRLAPAQREEGSGSTSDIEFKGMLASFPSLATTAEGRQMILTTIARQNEITRMRIEVADQWTQGEIPATEARKKIAAIDKASIYASEDEKKLIRKMAGTEKGGDLGKAGPALTRDLGGKRYEQRGGLWYLMEGN